MFIINAGFEVKRSTVWEIVVSFLEMSLSNKQCLLTYYEMKLIFYVQCWSMFSSMAGKFCKYVYVKDASITFIEKLIHLKWSLSCWMTGIVVRNVFNKMGVTEHEIIQTLIKFVNSCNFKWNSIFLVYCSYICLIHCGYIFCEWDTDWLVEVVSLFLFFLCYLY